MLRPLPECELLTIDGAHVLFSETQQRIYEFNESAAFIWRLLCKDLTPEQITGRMARRGVPRAVSRSFVQSALQQWAELGLLQKSEDVRRTAGCPEAYYALLDTTFRIQYESPEQEAAARSAIGHLQTAPARRAVTITLAGTQDGITVTGADGRIRTTFGGLEELAPALKAVLWTEAVNRARFLFGFHAGVVGDEAGVCLLPGRSGSGKTTLTAKLIARGLSYFSDEMALVTERFEVLPVPLALCIKEAGREAVSDLWPNVFTLPLHRRGDGKRVAYLPPPDAAETCRKVRLIVFPTFDPQSRTVITPLSRIDALRRLLEENLSVGRKLEAADLRRLSKFLGGIKVYALRFSASDAGATAILSLMTDHGDREDCAPLKAASC